MFKNQLKLELKYIQRNRNRFIGILIIVMIIPEISLALDLKETVENKNTLTRYTFSFFNFMITIMYIVNITTIMPFVEEMFFRKLLYLEIKPKETLEEAVKKSKWCMVLYYIVIISINSIIFALAHYIGRESDFFPWSFIYYIICGALFSLCCELCNSVLSSIFMHMFFNTWIMIQRFVLCIYLLIKMARK